MSLVYEALQKAEREKERKTGSVPVQAAPIIQAKELPRPVVAVPVTPQPAQPSRNYIPALIVCVSVVALAAIVYIVAIAAKSFTEKRPATAVPTPAVVNEGTPSVASEPKAEQVPTTAPPANTTANDSRFKLTGIMKMGENYGAVINGHIIYDNQYVDGAIVKKVERDRVTLNVDGRDIVVRLF